MNILKTPEEIKKAVDEGLNVYCGSNSYKVIKDNQNQYLIVCTTNKHAIGLTGEEGTEYETKLNGTSFYST
jgi:hypothetical protein